MLSPVRIEVPAVVEVMKRLEQDFQCAEHNRSWPCTKCRQQTDTYVTIPARFFAIFVTSLSHGRNRRHHPVPCSHVCDRMYRCSLNSCRCRWTGSALTTIEGYSISAVQ